MKNQAGLAALVDQSPEFAEQTLDHHLFGRSLFPFRLRLQKRLTQHSQKSA
jgi:hypothetical protein